MMGLSPVRCEKCQNTRQLICTVSEHPPSNVIIPGAFRGLTLLRDLRTSDMSGVRAFSCCWGTVFSAGVLFMASNLKKLLNLLSRSYALPHSLGVGGVMEKVVDSLTVSTLC